MVHLDSRGISMTTIEERVAHLEGEQDKLRNDSADLKKTLELQTIAIGALVNKTALERLNEKYNKLFDSLISHDRFTNEQLAELRSQQTELDGKVVGLQVEMHQRFGSVDAHLDHMDTRFDNVDARFDRLEGLIAQIFERLS